MVALLNTPYLTRGMPSPIALPLRPSRPALELMEALDSVRRTPTILDAMRASDRVVSLAASHLDTSSRDWVVDALSEATKDDRDSVTGIAAIHALGRIPGRQASQRLATLLDEGQHGADAHAAWSAIGRSPAPELLRSLVSAIARAGVVGMHSQRILASWAPSGTATVVAALEAGLAGASGVGRRALTETIGLVPGPEAARSLVRIAMDESEGSGTRRTAVMAFSGRMDERLPLEFQSLSRRTDDLGEAVRWVHADRALARRAARASWARRDGLHVAQVHLGSVIDERMSRGGVGDTGGIATLLSRLGGALADTSRVSLVTTISRATDAASRSSSAPRHGQRFESIPLEHSDAATFMSEWPSLIAAERGIQRVFLADRPPDVVHLRMADPGTLAAANVARRMGIPIVFTLAPDPHGPIQNAERAGMLTRAGFAAEDARGHLWFRASLVERMAEVAEQTALFPRTDLPRQLDDLLGVDVTKGRPRFTVVPEGIDMERTREAERSLRVAEGSDVGGSMVVVAELVERISQLPAERHGLPLVVSVGRMHQSKGMVRVVEAFAQDHGPGAEANLVIVGGDLDAPSAAESAELARIHAALERHPGLADRVVLLGHRPHAEAALVLAAARHGYGDVVAPDGAYVCGSVKEEFGLAIVEALAAGLPVTAPRNGGPSTYVEEGVTGTLVDTLDVAHIATGLSATLKLSRRPATAHAARSLVERHYTIARMAARLAAIYRLAAAPRVMGRPTQPAAAR